MFNSNYHAFSLGRVVANKERESRLIKIHPFEILPHMEEEMDDSTRQRKKEGIDHVERKYSVTVTEQAWLEADWIGATYFEKAPDVAKGELVMIYRAGDSDKFYWDVFGRNDSHRMQEDVVISFSAKPQYDAGEPVPKDETNSYRIRINSYEKFIEMTTSEANEEVTTYKMKWDMAAGTFEMVDKETNRIFLNTPETFWEIYNKDNTYLRLDEKKIFMHAEERIQFDTDLFQINCETYELNCANGTVDARETFTIEAGSELSMSAPTTTMEANNATLNFKTCTVGDGAWTFNAIATFNKPVVANASLTAGGGADFKGRIKFNPPLKGDEGFQITGN